MILMDVNILVYAHREDTGDHPAYRDWVEETINGRGAYGVSELVLSGFIRVITHPKVFERPTPLAVALDVVNQIRGQKKNGVRPCLLPRSSIVLPYVQTLTN
jgi:uncharacterized protein